MRSNFRDPENLHRISPRNLVVSHTPRLFSHFLQGWWLRLGLTSLRQESESHRHQPLRLKSLLSVYVMNPPNIQ